jgi:hypothetical protein
MNGKNKDKALKHLENHIKPIPSTVYLSPSVKYISFISLLQPTFRYPEMKFRDVPISAYWEEKVK